LSGVFAYSHLDFEADSKGSSTSDPTIAEMIRVAIQMLLKNTHGFILIVEGKLSQYLFRYILSSVSNNSKLHKFPFHTYFFKL